MIRFKPLILASAILASTAAVAHSDATNPAVIARMDAMKAIGGAMKTLSTMAKGEMEFDATAGNGALETMAMKAAEIPALFEAQESDPESEASDAIWTNWDDFVAKAGALEAGAKSVTITSADDIGAAMGAVGGSCKSCHTAYKL